MSDEKVILTKAQAVALLPAGEEIHTFRIPELDHIALWVDEELLGHKTLSESECAALANGLLELMQAGANEEVVKRVAELLVLAATDSPLDRNFRPPANFPRTYLGDGLYAVQGNGLAVQVRANSFDHPTDVVTFGPDEIDQLNKFYSSCFGDNQ